ncbi:BZ3500_MvSof-1268-A1-R1_Chr10-2g02828 [Microbotryum saponariae]|uniref:Phosphoribosylaminoimidazole carboxylase n=1 Tax=Microbotryum saponariae TaxID=289078 RepID=A0A2X0MAG9_9BASI|nr:BZ3501_MvSof-1269-A2-R1_Chr10-2g02419 [Microbotryum saponariae]SDA01598.1 BZ3500_MvSof-1268-A1-R1_Chr10-2g02828 [Microbotryum saponariae]
MLLQAASPLSIPIIVLDPEEGAPAKQVSAPERLPLSQLASTSSQAGSGPGPLSHLNGPFTSESHIRQLAQNVDILTIEIEHVDVAALERVQHDFASTGGRSGEGVRIYPAPAVIRTIQDKYTQKLYLQERGIAVAPFLPIMGTGAAAADSVHPRADLRDSVRDAAKDFGYPLMLKSRHLAYDGKGNFVLRSENDIELALQALIPDSSLTIQGARAPTDRLYAEKWAAFVKEVAVMVVRGADGSTRSYPAVETVHRDSICHIVYAPLRPLCDGDYGVGSKQKGVFSISAKPVDERAQELAVRAIDALGEGAVGVFGVEMFWLSDGQFLLVDSGDSCAIADLTSMSTGRLLLNEIAPRPHNSGHYTIEACSISQYTAHLYAILSLPLPPIQFLPRSSAMLNLLGLSSSAQSDFMGPSGVVRKAIEFGAAVHLYGKAGCRKGRKMGHVTIVGESDEIVRSQLEQLVELLPGEYAEKAQRQEATRSARSPLVSIVMGSDSDLPIMLNASSVLRQFEIPFELSIVSAHRTPGRMVEFARTAASRGIRVIIAGAGGAAHLPGMIASETILPVIGVPVKGSSLDGVDSLYSIVQMPRGIPVAAMAINNSMNAGLLAVRILAAGGMGRLNKALAEYAAGLEDEVLAKVQTLENIGWDAYAITELAKK